jgi:hypothetical protein
MTLTARTMRILTMVGLVALPACGRDVGRFETAPFRRTRGTRHR